MQPPILDRRRFLAVTGGAVAGTSLATKNTLARIPALERITVAVIGVGSRGIQVMRQFLAQPAVQVVAVCDVHDLHYRDNPWGKGSQFGREPAQQMVEKHYAQQQRSGEFQGCAAESDFRRVLERDDVDAVVVATPDHWHARIARDAVRSGKDVYGEKPVTHYFAEGQVLYREVEKHNAVFQVGSQQRSEAVFRQAVELVRNGHLGRVHQVEVGLPPGYDTAQDDTSVSPLPRGLDYNFWCGPAEQLPYMRARHHQWWRSTRAFGGGVLMDWIGHHNDIAHWGINADSNGPVSVEAQDWTKSGCPLYDTPAQYTIRCEYPGEVELVISSQLEQGTRWYGEDGWLWVNRGKIDASNKAWLSKGFDRGSWKAYASPGHVQNFVECVASREACVTTAEIGHRSITPGHLGYVSNAVGRKLKWDSTREQILDDDAAQELLMRAPARQPWSVIEEA